MRTRLILASALLAGCSAPQMFHNRDDMWKAAKACLADDPYIVPCVTVAQFAAQNAKDDDDRAMARKLAAEALNVYKSSCGKAFSEGCVSFRATMESLMPFLPPGTNLGTTEEGVAAMCSESKPSGCASASEALETGAGVQVDRKKAMSMAVLGCLAGDKPSCEQAQGLAGRSPDVGPAAVAGLKAACAGTDVRGCAPLVRIAEVRSDLAGEALAPLRALCEAGNQRVCQIAFDAVYKVKNNDEHLRWTVVTEERVCLEGGPARPSACWGAANVGHNKRISALYPDRAREVRLLEIGCKLDTEGFVVEVADICADLARHLDEGLGTSRDAERARTTAQRACQLHGSACTRLARDPSTPTPTSTAAADTRPTSTTSSTPQVASITYVTPYSSLREPRTRAIVEFKMEVTSDQIMGAKIPRSVRVLGFRPTVGMSGEYKPCRAGDCEVSEIKEGSKTLGWQVTFGSERLYFTL